MQLYLLRTSELRMNTLPQKVSGQQVIEYTADNGEIKPLVRINAKDDKWYLNENRHVQIANVVPVEGSPYGEIPVEENSIYYLRLDKKEIIALLVESNRDDSTRYMRYTIPNDGVIDIGSSSKNRVFYNHPDVAEVGHVYIRYKNGNITVQDGRKNGAARNTQAYLNGKGIGTKEIPAKLGDIIFLFGLKIVLGPDFIAVNNPGFRVFVTLAGKNAVLFTPSDIEVEESELEKIFFSVAPSENREYPHREFKIENPPAGINESDTPWIVMLGPSITMAMGSVFSSIITINNVMSSGGNITAALPSLVSSIIMVMGSAVWPTIGRRAQKRSQIRKAEIASSDYEKYLRRLKNDIDEAKLLQKSVMVENNPTVSECLDTIINQSSKLWERSRRRNSFLEVMIGRGDVELDAAFSFQEKTYHSEISHSAKAMYDLVAGKHEIEDVPITLTLKDCRMVGVIGERKKEISFGKALLLELTAMHDYEDLKIVCIYDRKEQEEWDFVKWIPHVWNEEKSLRFIASDANETRYLSDYLANIMAVSSNNRTKEIAGPHYVIIAADRTLAERCQAIKELYDAPEDYSNISLIALYDERAKLPKACSHILNLITENEHSLEFQKYGHIQGILSDLNRAEEQILRDEVIGFYDSPKDAFVCMSNIQLNSNSTSKRLPTQYTFMEMMKVGRAEHLDLLRRWKENNAVSSLATPIGVDADGYYINLDIHEKAHGPHGVIAGMTGSGKSEFIIAYLASLAVNYSPEDIAFVLIDFKGGGMADIFKNLPHTAGLITNLDGNELRRSFLAIEKELEKRQKLFKAISDQKKISNIDIYKYQKLRLEDPSMKPLPHLILVSDEFAELKQQHRDFMEQLIRIARIGRSLGVHLILATQKPDGVVDDQIKSNIRFKICLKVQDKSDSQSMIECPDATLITNSGRFYFKVGNGEVFEYGQSPWSGASYEPQDHAYKNNYDYIEILNHQGIVIFKEEVQKAKRPEGLPEKQIDALVQFISEVAVDNNMRAEKLWLSPLAGPKEETKKETVFDTTIRPFTLNPTIGMYDDLMNQKHLPLTIPFTEEGNTLLYGASGSGKLEFINTMLISIMNSHGPEEVNFYLGDYDSGSLEAFADSCYTKMYVGAGDRAGVDNMFEELSFQMAERREMMRRFGGSYTNYIKNSGKVLPMLLIVIHNYMNVADLYPDIRQRLTQLAREGTKYGMFVLVSGTASNSIPYSIQPLFKNVYTLRQNSDDQYRDILGKTEGILPDHFRGRGLVRADKVVCEFQTDIVFEDANSVYEAIQNFCDQKNIEYGDGNGQEISRIIQSEPVDQKQEVKTNSTILVEEKLQISQNEDERNNEQRPVSVNNNGNSEHRYHILLGHERLSKKKYTLDLTAVTTSLMVFDDLHIKQMEMFLDRVRQMNGTIYEMIPGHQNCSDQVKQIWNEMLLRAKSGQEAKAVGNPIPEFTPIYVLAKNPIALAEELPNADRTYLATMMSSLTPAYRIFFVLIERSEIALTLDNGKYYSKNVPFAQGVILTTDKSVYQLFKEDVLFAGNARKPYGFVIEDNVARLIEFDSKEDL